MEIKTTIVIAGSKGFFGSNLISYLEKKQGFRESVMTKDKNNNINFFNLGPSNNYRELLDNKTITEMNNLFQNQLKEFNYE